MQCTCTIYLYLLPRCPKNFRHWISKIGLMIFSYKPASCFHEALGETFFLGLEINCLNEANPFADPLWSASTGLALCFFPVYETDARQKTTKTTETSSIFPVVSPLNQFVNMSQKTHLYTSYRKHATVLEVLSFPLNLIERFRKLPGNTIQKKNSMAWLYQVSIDSFCCLEINNAWFHVLVTIGVFTIHYSYLIIEIRMDVLLEQMRQKGQVDVQPRKLTCNLSMSFGKGYFLPKHQFEGKFQGVEDDFASKTSVGWEKIAQSPSVLTILAYPGSQDAGCLDTPDAVFGSAGFAHRNGMRIKVQNVIGTKRSSANWLRNFGWTSRWNRYKHTHVDWQYFTCIPHTAMVFWQWLW